MEPVVFSESPLAEYLEANGEDDPWGIDPAPGDSEPESATFSFAPSSSFTSRLHAKKLQPLRTSEPGWRRRTQFYELFSKAIDSRLSRSENSRFLERFRYIIVASQLLNEHVNVSHYNQRIGESSPSSDDDESVAFFGPRFAKLRYWAGNGGCILAISVLVGWVFRWGDRQSHISRGRTIIALFMSMVVGIVLFAHNRRRWLRVLRGRAIELASQFVENSQTYDILASNAVTFIQEVELVSRGYRLSAPLPPISRLERDSQTRRCTRLRRSLMQQLSQAMTPHSVASSALRGLINESDLDKYYDIYDIGKEDIEDAELGMKDLELEDPESIKTLKTLLHRLHNIRRVFLCFLLALDANGGYSDFATWRTVVQELKSLGSIMGELGQELRRIGDEEQRFNVPPTPKVPLSPTNERWRGQLRKLNSLSQALRGLQAKMHVLREESDLTSQDSMDLTEFGPHLLSHYDSIGADLHALVAEWESGRALLALSIDKQDARNSMGSIDLNKFSPTGSTLAGDTPRNSYGGGKAWEDMIGSGLASPANAGSDKDKDENSDEPHQVVFEAVADPRPVRNSLSKLTREERIKKVQEERVRLAEERERAKAGATLVKELQTVLTNRQPNVNQGKRMSVRMS